jgi:hypothetical protein
MLSYVRFPVLRPLLRPVRTQNEWPCDHCGPQTVPDSESESDQGALGPLPRPRVSSYTCSYMRLLSESLRFIGTVKSPRLCCGRFAVSLAARLLLKYPIPETSDRECDKIVVTPIQCGCGLVQWRIPLWKYLIYNFDED